MIKYFCFFFLLESKRGMGQGKGRTGAKHTFWNFSQQTPGFQKNINCGISQETDITGWFLSVLCTHEMDILIRLRKMHMISHTTLYTVLFLRY